MPKIVPLMNNIAPFHADFQRISLGNISAFRSLQPRLSKIWDIANTGEIETWKLN